MLHLLSLDPKIIRTSGLDCRRLQNKYIPRFIISPFINATGRIKDNMLMGESLMCGIWTNNYHIYQGFRPDIVLFSLATEKYFHGTVNAG